MTGHTPVKKPVEHVVILIHGIHSYGAWHQAVAQALESESVRVVAPRYGWFSGLRFIAPWDASGAAKERVYREFLNARRQFPDARISVIAHSFGTQLLTRLLLKYPDIRVCRIILCGSVVRQGFEWERIADQIGDDGDQDKTTFIVNDCGNRDVWPVIGASAGWRYGNAGTDGFGSLYVRDRFHHGGHGLYFDPEFIGKYWKPFIEDGTYVKGDANQGECVSWYVRAISHTPLRYLQILLPIVLVAVGLFFVSREGSQPLKPAPSGGFAAFVDKLNELRELSEDAAADEAAKLRDDYQDAKFTGWQAYITRREVENSAYYIWWWKEQPQPPPTKPNRVYALFDPQAYNKSDKIGSLVTFDGIVESIEEDGHARLSGCRLTGR